jgi:hypothetical protein
MRSTHYIVHVPHMLQGTASAKHDAIEHHHAIQHHTTPNLQVWFGCTAQAVNK